MDIKFENRTTITKSMFEEYHNAVYRLLMKDSRPKLLKIAVLLVIITVLSYIGEGVNEFLLLLSLLTVGVIFMYFRGDIFIVKKSYKIYKESNGPSLDTRFGEKEIELVTTRYSSNIQYSAVTRIIETPDLYILMVENMGLIIDKHGFIVGNAAEFLTFANEKCLLKTESHLQNDL